MGPRINVSAKRNGGREAFAGIAATKLLRDEVYVRSTCALLANDTRNDMAATLTPLERELVDSLKRTAKNIVGMSPIAKETFAPLVRTLEQTSNAIIAGKVLLDTKITVRLGDVVRKLFDS